MAKTQKYKLIYDGDCPFNTEIVSNKFLENYSKNYKINSYPSHIFYLLKDKASDVGNIEQIIDHLILMVHSNYLQGVNLLEMEETYLLG